MRKYGVSPAYFISGLSDRFPPEGICSSLPGLKALGYDAFQMEVFHPSTLEDWVQGGSAKVTDTAHANDLQITQFVAHFLLHGFKDTKTISGSWGIEECGRVVEMLTAIDECPVVTVPLPALELEPGKIGSGSRGQIAYQTLWESAVKKLSEMARLVHASGRRLALEIMPGSLVGGSDGYLRMQKAVSKAGYDIGYNFDTGHAWAQREPVWLIPAKVGAAMTGTHISDNDASANDSLRPGAGTVPWKPVMQALSASGYTGPIDIEIKCAPEEVHAEYQAALRYMQALERVGSE